MNSTKQSKRKKSLRKRIITTMVICILVPFLILTIALVLQLLSNIDEFITNAAPPGSYDYLEAFKAPIIVTFIIIAAVIIFVIISAVIRISRRITLPISDLTQSIENITEGDLTQEISLDGRVRGDEIGILAQSFQNLLVTMRLGNKSYYQGDMYLALEITMLPWNYFKQQMTWIIIY